MPNLTKTQVRAAVRQYIDDPDATRWNEASLDALISMVYDNLWSDILDVAPYLTSKYQQVAAPLNPPGFINLNLTVDGGDLTERFHRVQQLLFMGRHYSPKDPRDYLLIAQANTGDVSTVVALQETSYTYYIMGDELWMHPLTVALGSFVEFRYSFKPPSFLGLPAGSPITFPNGQEHALVLTASAHGLIKGNAEDAGQLFAMADVANKKMLAAVRRQYHGPTVPFTTGTSQEYGGI